MKPRAWSFSALELFTTCARKYHEERITKSVVDEDTEAKSEGLRQHKHFEDRLGPGKVALPEYMAQHEGFMRGIEAKAVSIQVERKVALNAQLQPCGFFDRDCWWRGVIDVEATLPDGSVVIVDYKTGKPHNKVRQLHLFAIHAFVRGAPLAECMFYWTRTLTTSKIVLPQTQFGPLLKGIVPDLREYVDAFKFDIWPPKPNGLCQNHCAVTECEFHGRGQYRR